MRDPFTWSLALPRMFGITVRVHLVFVLVAVGLIFRWAFQTDIRMPFSEEAHKISPTAWIDVAMLMGLLLVSVLLHELGHCYAARLVDGEAHELMLWPLGGLAPLEVPHTPRANFITTLAGPLVNLFLCLACALILFTIDDNHYQPPWNPFTWIPIRTEDGNILLSTWQGSHAAISNVGVALVARLFYLNWILFFLNIFLVGFPLDGARLFQCLLWPRLGYHQATVATIYVGFFTMLACGIFAIITNELLPFCLSLFIGVCCWRQWVVLVTGGEESLLGYDFSQGYTSLEREQPPPRRRRRPNFYQRWLKRRAARRLQREQELREAEENRMDQLLEKVQREGLQALSDEERRFLKRVSDKYRNRQ